MHITLRLLDDFRCLAGDCPAHCCGAWNIVADAGVLDGWRGLANDRGDPAPLASISEQVIEGRRYALIAKSASGDCVHLDGRGLCAVQLRHGHEALPAMCRNYPRFRIHGSGTSVNTAELSCPAIAAAVLAADPAHRLFQGAAPVVATGLSPEQDLALTLDAWAHELLSQRRFPLNVRIFELGRVLAVLAGEAERRVLDAHTLRRVCKGSRQALYDASRDWKTGRLTSGEHGRFWELAVRLAREAGALAEPALAGRDGAAAVPGAIDDLAQAGRPAVMSSHAGALENYFAVSLVNQGFPFRPPGGNLLAAFMATVVPFAIVQLTAWGRAAAGEPLDAEALARVVYTVERRFRHTSTVCRALNESPALLEISRDPRIYLTVC